MGTLSLAINGGGTVWAGGSYDPDTHIMYVYSRRNPASLNLIKPDDVKVNDMNFVSGNAITGARTARPMGAPPGQGVLVARGARDTGADGAEGGPAAAAPAGGGGGEGGPAITVEGLPIVKPPYGSISAISLDKGEILWQIAHGDTPDNIRNHAALKGVTIPRTGQNGIIGTLVTKTLLIAGEAVETTGNHPRGALLRAYDKATGKDVGGVLMPARQSGSPMTYMLNGRQYIVVAVGGGGVSGELVAFRLPANPTTN
jgi:quinoprotein glucose dehydrogenase